MDVVNQTPASLEAFASYFPDGKSLTIVPDEIVDFPVCYFHSVIIRMANSPHSLCRFYLSPRFEECTCTCSGNLQAQLTNSHGAYRLTLSYQN